MDGGWISCCCLNVFFLRKYAKELGGKNVVWCYVWKSHWTLFIPHTHYTHNTYYIIMYANKNDLEIGSKWHKTHPSPFVNHTCDFFLFTCSERTNHGMDERCKFFFTTVNKNRFSPHTFLIHCSCLYHNGIHFFPAFSVFIFTKSSPTFRRSDRNSTMYSVYNLLLLRFVVYIKLFSLDFPPTMSLNQKKSDWKTVGNFCVWIKWKVFVENKPNEISDWSRSIFFTILTVAGYYLVYVQNKPRRIYVKHWT